MFIDFLYSFPVFGKLMNKFWASTIFDLDINIVSIIYKQYTAFGVIRKSTPSTQWLKWNRICFWLKRHTNKMNVWVFSVASMLQHSKQFSVCSLVLYPFVPRALFNLTEICTSNQLCVDVRALHTSVCIEWASNVNHLALYRRLKAFILNGRIELRVNHFKCTIYIYIYINQI